jgi:hypothetical protein
VTSRASASDSPGKRAFSRKRRRPQTRAAIAGITFDRSPDAREITFDRPGLALNERCPEWDDDLLGRSESSRGAIDRLRMSPGAGLSYRAEHPPRLANWCTARCVATSRSRARPDARKRPSNRPWASFSSRPHQLSALLAGRSKIPAGSREIVAISAGSQPRIGRRSALLQRTRGPARSGDHCSLFGEDPTRIGRRCALLQRTLGPLGPAMTAALLPTIVFFGGARR